MEGPVDVSEFWKPFRRYSPLQEDSIHVFKIDVPDFYSKIDRLFADVLSFEEQQKANRFKHEQDSRRYICSRYVLRYLLSGFKGVSPQSIHFDHVFNKKPVLKGIEFNVSHSGDRIIIGIGLFPLGIDIELIRPDFDFQPLVNEVLNPEEQLQIETSSTPISLFYSLWTRKEALLKASGEGLTDGLSELNCLKDYAERNKKNYRLNTFLTDKNYIFSLATTQISANLFFWEATL